MGGRCGAGGGLVDRSPVADAVAQGFGIAKLDGVEFALFLPGPQLVEELEREQQSKQQLEGERRETESNWEAQIADILSWWGLRG